MSRDDYPKTNNGPKHGPGAMIGREKPKSFITMKVPMMETGTASRGMTEARQF